MVTKLLGSTALSALRNLPPFPPVAVRLMSLLGQDRTSFAEAAQLLSTDAGLSAEVLRLANSPLGARYGASSVLQALSILGLARVSGLVLTLSVARFLGKASRSPLMLRCWRHNLACALAAREFADIFDVDPEQAYTAGLLHDLGRLALLTIDARRYELIAAKECDTREEEESAFGLDHCAAGAWVISQWRLPPIYAEVAAGHHEMLAGDQPIRNLVHVACSVAKQLGFSVTGAAAAEEPLVSDHLGYAIAATINALECEYGL